MTDLNKKNIDAIALILEREAAQKASDQSMKLMRRGRPTGEQVEDGEDEVVYCSVPGCNVRAFHGYCARHSAERQEFIRRAVRETREMLHGKKL